MTGEDRERVLSSAPAVLDVGYFVTPHVRVSAGIGPRRNDIFGADEFEQRPQGRHLVLYEPRNAVLTSAVTYQFRENAFVHPFASAGLYLGWYYREERQESGSGTAFSVTVLGSSTEREVRPFVSAGAKAYFGNGRAFIRPEIALSGGSTSAMRPLVRLGVGVDF